MSKKDIEVVKETAKELLETLKAEKLVYDWRKKQSSRAKVRDTIEEICDSKLPDAYDEHIFMSKCASLFEHFYDQYIDAKNHIYEKVVG